MQSNQARIAVGAVALIVIVALFVVFSGGGEDQTTTTTEAAVTTTTEAADSGGEGADQRSQPAKPPKPEFKTIVVEGGEPVDGVADLSYEKGDEVRLEVKSDIDEELHVHGYDLYEDVAAGGKAKFSFPATIDGVFEIELEESGVQIAQLTVNP
jgi:hypothetical protein